MTYTELKNTDIFSFSNLDEAKNFIDVILESERNDIIKYINYLKWKQYHKSDIREMKFISKFLSVSEDIIKLEETCGHELGLVEDFVFEIKKKKKKKKSKHQTIIVDGVKEKVLATLVDNFEFIYIIKDDGILKHFGSVSINDNNYIYELPEEPIHFLEEIIKMKDGSKVNINAHYLQDAFCKKTFLKISEKVEGNEYLLTKKTINGVMAPVKGGTFKILKSEKITCAELESTIDDLSKEKFDEYVKTYDEKYMEVINNLKEQLSKYKENVTDTIKNISDKIEAKTKEAKTETEEAPQQLDDMLETEENMETNFEDYNNDKVYNADELEFAICDDEGEDTDYPVVVIQPKGYFNKNGHLHDGMGHHNINNEQLLEGGTSPIEIEETTFEPFFNEKETQDILNEIKVPVDEDKWREKMIKVGFTYCKELEDFLI